MPVITSIKSQKNKKRINIYLDDRFGFGIDLDNFVLLHLKIDQVLSDEEVKKIIEKSDFQKSFEKILRFAMVRPRSLKEYKDYLKRKNIDESIHRSIFEKLEKLKLLNDEEFAKWWVDTRIAQGKSRRIMNYELGIKGVDKEIIEKVLSEVKIDEVKMAKKLLEKKAYKWNNLESRLAGLKMSQYLMVKGFGWNVVGKVVKDMLK